LALVWRPRRRRMKRRKCPGWWTSRSLTKRRRRRRRSWSLTRSHRLTLMMGRRMKGWGTPLVRAAVAGSMCVDRLLS
jgi:hypothetical protein